VICLLDAVVAVVGFVAPLVDEKSVSTTKVRKFKKFGLPVLERRFAPAPHVAFAEEVAPCALSSAWNRRHPV